MASDEFEIEFSFKKPIYKIGFTDSSSPAYNYEL